MTGFLFSSCMALAALCSVSADRQAHVDAQGVMRWIDDGGEVAVQVKPYDFRVVILKGGK